MVMSSAIPVVGITTSLQGPSEERPFSRTGDIVYGDMDYARQVEQAGGLPVLLPYLRNDAISEIVNRLDGLLLSGGEDIHPRRYNHELTEGVCALNEARDAFEFSLVAAYLETGKPLFAICRGIQLINVLFGGTLIQDLPLQTGQTHHTQLPPFNRCVHSVMIRQNSRLAAIIGESAIPVNSTHHQAVDGLGKELIACGWSEEGIIEAIEHPNHRFLLGVQWHPERLGQNGNGHARLFRSFIESCGEETH